MTETTHSWQFRCYCISSHIARRYGVVAVDETHGGQAEHYGWPRRSVGIEWSWRHNTWFCGWELRKARANGRKRGKISVSGVDPYGDKG